MTPLPLGILALSGVVAGGAFDLLETTTTSASSITFTGLGSYTDYKHLQIRMVARSNVSNPDAVMQFNGASSNYSEHYLHAFQGNSAPTSEGYSSTPGIGQDGGLWRIAGTNRDSSTYQAGVIDIADFASAQKNKTAKILSGIGGFAIMLISGARSNTDAITSITIKTRGGSNFQNSRFSLYGVK
jgi:hypothetical protein